MNYCHLVTISVKLHVMTHFTGKLTIVGFFSRMNVVLLNLCEQITTYHVTVDKILMFSVSKITDTSF